MTDNMRILYLFYEFEKLVEISYLDCNRGKKKRRKSLENMHVNEVEFNVLAAGVRLLTTLDSHIDFARNAESHA